MQQLLGDKAASADPSFLKELFLQRLPPNVRMVLASTKEPEKLEDLASLADRVGEVATPTVSSIQTSQLSSEVEQLRAEIGRLKSLVQSLSSGVLLGLVLPALLHATEHLVCVGIILTSGRKLANVMLRVPGPWETVRPVTNGGK